MNNDNVHAQFTNNSTNIYYKIFACISSVEEVNTILKPVDTLQIEYTDKKEKKKQGLLHPIL